MQQWIGGWGYRVTDFSLFPLCVENETQRIIVLHNMMAHHIRIKFSNQYGRTPLPINHATIAKAGEDGDILPQTSVQLTFNGDLETVLEPGEERYSDEVAFCTRPKERIAVSLYIKPKTKITGVCSSQSKVLTTVKNAAGGDYCLRDKIDGYDQHEHFTAFLKEKPLYTCFFGVSQIEFLSDQPVKTVVCFGDSITQQGHWSEAFSRSLYSHMNGRISILNRGICGNRILHDASIRCFFGGYFGMAGVDRFEEDVFAAQEAKIDAVIFLEGINDLLQPRLQVAPAYEFVSAEEIIEGMVRCERIAHEHNARIYIGTILPFKGYMDAWNEEDEGIRQKVNEWIRSGKHGFDGVIDFEMAMKSETDPSSIKRELQSGDMLHPNEAGGAVMASQIPFEFFE